MAAARDATPDPRVEDLYARAVRACADEPHAVAPCPVCGAPRARRRFAVAGIASPVVVCEDCGTGRYHPMPGAAEIAGFYPAAYYGAPGAPGSKFRWWVEALDRLAAKRRAAWLARGLPPGARVLDVGCGRGLVLGSLARRGFDAHGVELCERALRGADPDARLRIAPRLADAGYPPSSFDQVLIWHVLEHLPDPRGTLDEVRRILRPGGRLVVAVPHFASRQARWSDAAWFHLDLPRHLHHFPLRALHRLLDETGFERVSDHHFSLRQNPFGWIQSAQNRLTGSPRNGLYALLLRDPADGSALPPAARIALWALLAAAAPIALAAAGWDALRRDGATVCVVALRRPGG